MKRPDCSLVQNMKKLQKSLKGRCAMDFKHEPDTNFKRPEALSGDILFARLQELEEKWPDLQSSDSPTQKVGAPPVNSLEKRKHAAPMLSLDAVREQAQISLFRW